MRKEGSFDKTFEFDNVATSSLLCECKAFCFFAYHGRKGSFCVFRAVVYGCRALFVSIGLLCTDVRLFRPDLYIQ